MGHNHRPKQLSDLHRYGAHLLVRCPGCGRTAIYPVKDVESYFRARRWNTAWEMVGMRFRCGNPLSGEGCGRKGAEVGMSPVHQPVEPRPPRPIAPTPPPETRPARPPSPMNPLIADLLRRKPR